MVVHYNLVCDLLYILVAVQNIINSFNLFCKLCYLATGKQFANEISDECRDPRVTFSGMVKGKQKRNFPKYFIEKLEEFVQLASDKFK